MAGGVAASPSAVRPQEEPAEAPWASPPGPGRALTKDTEWGATSGIIAIQRKAACARPLFGLVARKTVAKPADLDSLSPLLFSSFLAVALVRAHC